MEVNPLASTAKLGSMDVLQCLWAGLWGCILKIALKKIFFFEEMVGGKGQAMFWNAR